MASADTSVLPRPLKSTLSPGSRPSSPAPMSSPSTPTKIPIPSSPTTSLPYLKSGTPPRHGGGSPRFSPANSPSLRSAPTMSLPPLPPVSPILRSSALHQSSSSTLKPSITLQELPPTPEEASSSVFVGYQDASGTITANRRVGSRSSSPTGSNGDSRRPELNSRKSEGQLRSSGAMSPPPAMRKYHSGGRSDSVALPGRAQTPFRYESASARKIRPRRNSNGSASSSATRSDDSRRGSATSSPSSSPNPGGSSFVPVLPPLHLPKLSSAKDGPSRLPRPSFNGGSTFAYSATRQSPTGRRGLPPSMSQDSGLFALGFGSGNESDDDEMLTNMTVPRLPDESPDLGGPSGLLSDDDEGTIRRSSNTSGRSAAAGRQSRSPAAVSSRMNSADAGFVELGKIASPVPGSRSSSVQSNASSSRSTGHLLNMPSTVDLSLMSTENVNLIPEAAKDSPRTVVVPPSPHSSPPTTSERRHQPPLAIVPPASTFVSRPSSAASASSAASEISGSGRPSPPIPPRNPNRPRAGGRAPSGSSARVSSDSIPSTSGERMGNVDPPWIEEAPARSSVGHGESVADDGKAVSESPADLATPRMAALAAMADNVVTTMEATDSRSSLSSVVPAVNLAPNKDLPPPPTGESPASSATVEEGFSGSERNGWPRPNIPLRSAASITALSSPPPRSPSLPTFETTTQPPTPSRLGSKAGKNLQLEIAPRQHFSADSSPGSPNPGLQEAPRIGQHLRSQSSPNTPVIPQSPTMSSSARSSLIKSPGGKASKRAHLIHEICTTERGYAYDLGLVRDAYLYRLRPTSQHSAMSSAVTLGDKSPGGLSVGSRTSTFTFETAETRRSSLHDGVWGGNQGSTGMAKSGSLVTTPITEGVPLASSSADSVDQLSPVNYYANGKSPVSPTGPGGSGSTPNLTAYHKSPRVATLIQSGAAVSGADIKAIFLNLEALASFAEQLADSFERAVGDGTGEEVINGKPGEEGKVADSLGEVFLKAIPSMTALYTIYCARQAQANTRLMELMSDPKQAAYFNECWELVKPHTNAWDLGSLLIKPVQRVLKYPMLFTDLLACTSPAHPDYFNLRKAADGSRSVADEINEVKRRKDVVDRVISGASKRSAGTISSSNSLDRRQTGGVSMKFAGMRFGKSKDKDKPLINGHLPMVDARSEAQLKHLIQRLEDGDKVVRRVGKEVHGLPEKFRDLWLEQRNMMNVWSAVVQLEASDPVDTRIETFKAVIEEVVNNSLTDLENEIRNTIMPAFSTLLRLAVNPKAVIARRQSKHPDYTRVRAAKNKADLKVLGPSAIESAEEFVALHVQLVEELPAFLKGYTKILDLALMALARAQSKFHGSVGGKLRAFMTVWRIGDETDGEEDIKIEVLDGRSIVKRWHAAWKPFIEALDGLEIAQMPQSTSRPNTIRGQSIQQGVYQLSTDSHGSLTTRDIARDMSLNPNQFYTPNTSTSEMSRFESTTSLAPSQGPPPVLSRSASMKKPGMGGRLRSSSLVNQVLNKSKSTNGDAITEPVPKSPLRATASTANFSPQMSYTESSFGGSSTMNAFPSPPLETSRARHPFSSGALDMGSPTSPEFENYDPNQLGSMDEEMRRVSAQASWRDERSLYKCACVATFKLDVEVWYAGLSFVNIEEGDILDILHEVGRVDTLEDMPIDVGVADDGLLVAKTGAGKIGIVFCSYLQPLT